MPNPDEVEACVQNAGFTMAVTVFDRGRRFLTDETPDEASQCRKPFRCQWEKIFILFDIPLLFKCPRNNFQEAQSTEWLLGEEEARTEGSYLRVVKRVHLV